MKALAMLLEPGNGCAGPVAHALTRALEPVADDLRLVNVVDFVAYIHDQKLANLQDVVNSSAELYFKPGTLAFGWSAEVDLDWGSPPVVAFDIEFRHRSVWLVFKLILRDKQLEVTIKHVSLACSAAGGRRHLELILEAIADARCNPLNEQPVANHS